MKTKLFIMALAAGSLGIATQARATVILSTGPIGIVAWDEMPSFCKTNSGAGLASFTGGGVTFRPTSSGTIAISCFVTSIMRVDPSSVNALGLTFKNDNGFVGGVDQCKITIQLGAYPYAGGLPTLIGSFSTSGQSFTGRQTANASTSDFLRPDTNMYIVGVVLSRNSGAACNPVVYDSFLENVIP